jgi:hypothetical protein
MCPVFWGVRKIGAGLNNLCSAGVATLGFIRAMEVFAVTVFVSLLFGVLFAILFVAERLQQPLRSLEHDALMPLDDNGIIQPESEISPKSDPS